jgi:ATP-dependent Clp protease protease subunit
LTGHKKTRFRPGLVDIVGDEMIDDHCDTDPVWFPEMFKDW